VKLEFGLHIPVKFYPDGPDPLRFAGVIREKTILSNSCICMTQYDKVRFRAFDNFLMSVDSFSVVSIQYVVPVRYEHSCHAFHYLVPNDKFHCQTPLKNTKFDLFGSQMPVGKSGCE